MKSGVVDGRVTGSVEVESDPMSSPTTTVRWGNAR